MTSRAFVSCGFALLGVGYLSLFLVGGVTAAAAVSLWWMAPVGLFAASIANSTGAGGGVVFVPAFTLIAASGGAAFTTAETVAVSLLIQCFGMSAGAIGWLSKGRDLSTLGAPPRDLRRAVGLALVTTLPALWLTQAFLDVGGPRTLILFKGFSLVLGVALLASLRWREGNARLRRFDDALLLGIGVAGGVATALFSVGIGELLAVALFLRGLPLALCVSTGVIVSAVTVLGAAPVALGEVGPHLDVVAAAVPGVLLGGWLGRRLALKLGTKRLKALTGFWIAGSSLVLILRAAS